MIVIRLDRLLAERNVTLSDLARRVGIALPNLSLLKTGKTKEIRFALLDAICRELGCEPGDVIGRDRAAGAAAAAAPLMPAERRPANAAIDFLD